MSPGLASHVARNDDDHRISRLDGLLLRAGLLVAIHSPLRRDSAELQTDFCPHEQHVWRGLGEGDAQRRVRAGVDDRVADYGPADAESEAAGYRGGDDHAVDSGVGSAAAEVGSLGRGDKLVVVFISGGGHSDNCCGTYRGVCYLALRGAV